MAALEGRHGAPQAQRAIQMQVMRQPGSNTIAVADAVRRILPQMTSAMPPAAHLTVRQDRSKTIRAAFSDIQMTMLATLALVVSVIFVFLRNGSATVIPTLRCRSPLGHVLRHAGAALQPQ